MGGRRNDRFGRDSLGVMGLVQLFGIESPGLTAALAPGDVAVPELG